MALIFLSARNFILIGENNKRKLSNFSWHCMLHPKKEEGLGLPQLDILNRFVYKHFSGISGRVLHCVPIISLSLLFGSLVQYIVAKLYPS